MSIKHIFISHAGEDREIAVKLAEHLRNAGHDTKVDTGDLSLGDNTIEFINEAIANAHTVIILFSKHTENAKWQKLEINSAIWNEHAQEGGMCIVAKIDDSIIPPILGPKLYGELNTHSNESFQKFIDDLCNVILPEKTASSVIAEALKPTSQNPFRHLRAEYFENRPDLHAKTFAPPDALKVGMLEEMTPCFLEGSRGTGKSMLLLSLRARNYLLRMNPQSGEIKLFGFYLKLSRGAICNVGVSLDADSDPVEIIGQGGAQITDIASQEIIIQMIESMLSEISYCLGKNLIQYDRAYEKTLSKSLDAMLFGVQNSTVTSVDELLEKLANSHKQISDFVRRRFIYGEFPTVPIATFDTDQLKRIIKILKKNVTALKNTTFVVLLDEYENLFPYQQKIVNGFVKLGPPDISVKIAKKLGTGDISGTTSGQELQETHDYARLPLVYDVEDSNQRKAYLDLLRHIVINILRSECLSSGDVDELLPEDNSSEVDDDKLQLEVARLCRLDPPDFNKLPDNVRRDKSTYYREAATYRVLLGPKGKHPEKRFSGFSQLAFISSGVIRYFQEILVVAYHLTTGAANLDSKKVVLPPDLQSKAVHFVSQHNLTTLSRNVEKDGEALKYFLLDIGDCLRHKLLKHSSEPEAARLTIENPQELMSESMAPVRRLLTVGTREGVFQTKEGLPAFKPKHRSDPQPSEFNICRIFAPVLEISPRLRWRTQVKCEDLLSLLSNQRNRAVLELKAKLVKIKSNANALTLFEQD